MTYRTFIDLDQLAREAGCSRELACTLAENVLEGLHKSLLLNGLTGSLQEAMMEIDMGAAYHLGGIYTAIGERQTGTDVYETLMRLSRSEEWQPYAESMDVWRESLTDEHRQLVESGQENKD